MITTSEPSERRIGVSPIPSNIRSLLTELQRASLSRLEGFGWSIKFVRSQGLIEPVIVVGDPSGERHGVMLEDGRIDRESSIKIR